MVVRVDGDSGRVKPPGDAAADDDARWSAA
jgi:hypothetical protein